MQIRVWHKLFLAIFTISLILVVMTLVLSRHSFNKSFIEYQNVLDLDRSTDLIDALRVAHQKRNSWQGFIEDRPLWGSMVDRHWNVNEPFKRPPRSGGPMGGLDHIQADRLPLDDPSLENQTQPQREASMGGLDRLEIERQQLIDSSVDNRQAPQSPMGAGPRPPMGPGPAMGPGPGYGPMPLTLLDKDGMHIAGFREQGEYKFEIPILDKEKKIGSLLIWRSPELSESNSDADNQFIRQQQKSLWRIAILGTLVATLAALLLANFLLRPLFKLSTATRKFASGEFDSRISINRKDEIGEVMHEFNEMASKLENIEMSRRRWTADISHELRTPLTILRGEIQALSDGVRPLNKESVTSLGSEIGRLNKLVDDLYDLSLADSGSLNYRKSPHDLREIITQVTDHFEIELENKGLKLTLELPESPVNAQIDADRMMQLTHNLLKNSVRYTDAPGQIKIYLRSNKRSILLSIEDSAPGVNQEDLSLIFDRLYRTDDSRSRNSGGAGLGLSICQHIAEAHNGKLSAEESELGGIKITLKMANDE